MQETYSFWMARLEATKGGKIKTDAEIAAFHVFAKFAMDADNWGYAEGKVRPGKDGWFDVLKHMQDRGINPQDIATILGDAPSTQEGNVIGEIHALERVA